MHSNPKISTTYSLIYTLHKQASKLLLPFWWVHGPFELTNSKLKRYFKLQINFSKALAFGLILCQLVGKFWFIRNDLDFKIYHEYLQSRASKFLSLSSSTSSSVMVSHFWLLSRYSCSYLGSRIHEFYNPIMSHKISMAWGLLAFDNTKRCVLNKAHYIYCVLM